MDTLGQSLYGDLKWPESIQFAPQVIQTRNINKASKPKTGFCLW